MSRTHGGRGQQDTKTRDTKTCKGLNNRALILGRQALPTPHEDTVVDGLCVTLAFPSPVAPKALTVQQALLPVPPPAAWPSSSLVSQAGPLLRRL